MSLPMPSGSCWTKRTTESNRTAPEILKGFFAPYPPADASCRTSGHTPPNPLTFPPHRRRHARPSRPTRYLPRHQLPHSHTALLSNPRSCSQSKTRHAPRFPITQAQTRTAQPPSPLSSPFTSSPIPARLSYPSSLLRQNPAHPTLSRHAGTDPHAPAAQPAILPVTSFPIPTHLSSPADPYKNPGSRPPPGFFVISGSVRFPLQRGLR